jgi:hypothetical protein
MTITPQRRDPQPHNQATPDPDYRRKRPIRSSPHPSLPLALRKLLVVVLPRPKPTKTVQRHRGAQPGNQNALKHGRYVDKPPAGSRPRGGQPGNLNALKHGLYSRILTRKENSK